VFHPTFHRSRNDTRELLGGGVGARLAQYRELLAIGGFYDTAIGRNERLLYCCTQTANFKNFQ
jgi:hypothetical protein